MIDSIHRYKKAEIELKQAEKELNKAIAPYIQKSIGDIRNLHRIIELMPRTYKGIRRIYERILQIEDTKTT